MDSETLAGLKVAFNAGPSAELAKIICLSLVELKRFDEIIPYLSHIDDSIAATDILTIATAICENDAFDEALGLLNPDHESHQLLYARCLHDSGQTDEAKSSYLAWLESHPGQDSKELNRKFGIAVSDPPKVDYEKPKLTIVEKPELGSITNLLRYRQDSTDFSDVVGLANIKKQINKKIIMPFQRPSMFQRFKKKIGGGVLLFGPPGCGKTLLARATAGECSASFYNVEISDVLDMYIGESEQKLHAIFEKARAETPCVLFFDELEALAGKREHSRSSSSANVVSQFLTELDGFNQRNDGVLVLASTNVPWAIDAAFLRPGRFDRMFFVPPPDKAARAAILQHHIIGRPAAADIDFNVLATSTSGYSGADLYHLVEMAADEAIDESIAAGQDVAINFAHFRDALGDAKATTIEWLTTARNYARYANDGGRYNDVLEFLNKHGK